MSTKTDYNSSDIVERKEKTGDIEKSTVMKVEKT